MSATNAQAGYKKVVRITATDPALGTPTWLELAQNSVSFDFNTELLDVTDSETDGWDSSIAGLHSWSMSLDFNTRTGDAAQDMLLDAQINRTGLWVQYCPVGTDSGSTARQGMVNIESNNASGDVRSKDTSSASLKGCGAWTSVTI